VIRAAIFDLDGTLVDSNDLHVQAWQETIAAGWMSCLVGEKARGRLDFSNAIAGRQTNPFCDPEF